MPIRRSISICMLAGRKEREDVGEKRCVYPGSFDPVTNGHLDIIERAASLFDEVTVAILHNSAKVGRFSVEKRMAMLEKACAHLPNVRMDCFDGLLVEYMRQNGARVIIRGLRGSTDFDSESRMAQLNRQLAPEVDTLFLMSSPGQEAVSSSAVREIALFGGDITSFVPSCIVQDVRQAFECKP